MGWKLELVETGPATRARRMEVAWLGEIAAPAGVDDIGLDHCMAQRLLGDIQRAVVAVQEAALLAEADRLRRLDPTLRLKDYRSRKIQGLHGTLTIRVPRLVRIGTGAWCVSAQANECRRCCADWPARPRSIVRCWRVSVPG